MDTVTDDTRDREIQLLKASLKEASDERDELRRAVLSLQRQLADEQEQVKSLKTLVGEASRILEEQELQSLSPAIDPVLL